MSVSTCGGIIHRGFYWGGAYIRRFTVDYLSTVVFMFISLFAVHNRQFQLLVYACRG
jgi:hypothetical protein